MVNDRQIMQQCNKLSPENVVHFISFRFEKSKMGKTAPLLHNSIAVGMALRYFCLCQFFRERERKSIIHVVTRAIDLIRLGEREL